MTYDPDTQTVISRDGVMIQVGDKIRLPYSKDLCLVDNVGTYGLQAFVAPTRLRQVSAEEIDENFKLDGQPPLLYY